MITVIHAVAQCLALSMALYCLVMMTLRDAEDRRMEWSMAALWWVVVSLLVR